jgi:hypothetical protein
VTCPATTSAAVPTAGPAAANGHVERREAARAGPDPGYGRTRRRIRLAGLDEFPGAPDVPETAATFEENALLKARACIDNRSAPSICFRGIHVITQVG